MELIGGRSSGKTNKLIMESAIKQIPILVRDHKQADILSDQAKAIGVFCMPKPITLYQYLHNRYDSSKVDKNGLFIDDLDDIITYIFSSTTICAATWTRCEAVGKSVQWLKSNPHVEKKIKELSARNTDIIEGKPEEET